MNKISEKKYAALKNLSTTTLDVVRHFIINKLAQQIYECVECLKEGRDVIDWIMAEKFVDRCCDLHEYYDEFILFATIEIVSNNKLLQSEDYYRIFEKHLGGRVWTQCYQIIKRGLPPDQYGRIRVG